MLGDVLLINDMHKDAAQAIFERVNEARADLDERYRYVIGISGESGSGKSELAHALAKVLKEHHVRVKIIHTDNYYKIQPLLREEWRRNKGFDRIGLDEYDWIKIRKTIRDFKEQQECMIPCIDLIPEQVDKLITDFSKIDLLIIDGLYAINAPDVDMRVFIDLTYLDTLQSRLERAREAQDDFLERVLEIEHRIISAHKSRADYIIDKQYRVVDSS